MSDNVSVQQAEAVVKANLDLQRELVDVCKRGDLSVVKDFIVRGVDPHCGNRETALRVACRFGHLNIVKYLVEDQQCDVNVITDWGSTLLHFSCEGGYLPVIRYLVEDQHCSVNVTDEWGLTLLHISCEGGNLSVVKYLVEDQHCDVNVTDKEGSTPLHHCCEFGHLDVFRYLVEDKHCDVNVTDKWGSTLLHYSCLGGRLGVVRYLVENQHCDVNVTDGRGSTLLHYSCQFGYLNIVKYLVEDQHCDVNVTDNDGQTSLHHICKSITFSIETMEYLLNDRKVDPNQTTGSKESSLELVAQNLYSSMKDKKQSATRLLLTYGAKPPYETWNQFLEVDGPQRPAEAYSKLFLMGDPGGGKSTLAKSLEIEAEGFDRFLNRLRKVVNVDTKTAGIVPKDIISKSLGRVTVYDLAGHSEFYASHDIALRNALAGSPSSIIVLVADMRGGGKSFEAAVLKWCSFAENLYQESTDNLPFLIIVGSHKDSTSKANIIACRQLICSLNNSGSFTSFILKAYVPLDCRYSVSRHMEDLRAILAECSQLLKQQELLSFREHCFLVSMLDIYRDVPAVTVKEVIAKHLETAIKSSLQSFLPTDINTMVDICTQMNKRGNILYLSNAECPENSWIVLQKDVLLQQVNGSVFAPRNFKEHTAIATDTGVVPVSKLAAHFPDINTNLIVSFMCHLQFCLEVTDPEILQQLSISSHHPEYEQFLFFPSLVTIKAPVSVWRSADNFVYQFAWIVQCHKPDQFFPSRFLHLVIHRLAFLFAMAATTTSDQLSIQRKLCNVWKNGIFWISLDGVNVVAEFSNSNRLTILIGTRVDCELYAVGLRSKVISTVLKVKKVCCPKVDVDEYLAAKNSLAYPLTSDVELIEITDVCKSVVGCQAYCNCSNKSNAIVNLPTLLYFEPFMNFGKDVLKELFTKEECELTDEYLTLIADRAYSNTNIFIKILDISPSTLHSKLSSVGASTGVTSKLLCALQLWRDKEPTYHSLCQRLCDYSVFAGRNPLELAGVSLDIISQDVRSSELRTKLVSDSRTSPTGNQGELTRYSLAIEDLVRRTGVSNTQLNTEIIEQDLHSLAECFDNVETYLYKLGLNEGQQTDIKDLAYRRNTKTAMVEALKLWLQPNPFAATFRALLEILLELKRGDVAVKVCQCIT